MKKFILTFGIVLALSSTIVGASQAHIVPPGKANCIRNYPGVPYMYIYTPSLVPFLATGSNATETVWFRARSFSGDGKLTSESEWFYNYLTPGTATGSYWYRYLTGEVNLWQSTFSLTAGPFLGGYVNYDLIWYQNGREIHRDTVWPTHVFPRGDGSPANACGWLF